MRIAREMHTREEPEEPERFGEIAALCVERCRVFETMIPFLTFFAAESPSVLAALQRIRRALGS